MDLFERLKLHLAREDLKYVLCGDVLDPQAFVLWMKLRLENPNHVVLSLHERGEVKPDLNAQWEMHTWEELNAVVSEISDTIMFLLHYDLTKSAPEYEN